MPEHKKKTFADAFNNSQKVSIKTESPFVADFIARKLKSAGFDVSANGAYVESSTISRDELGGLMAAAED